MSRVPLKLEIKYEREWLDVSDYLVESDIVPLYSRRLNYEVQGDGFSFKVSSEFNNDRALEFAKEVKLTVNNISRFLGIVNFTEYNEDDLTYTIDCSNALTKLENYIVDYDTLHTTLAALDNFEAVDNEGSSHTSLKNILTAIFSIAGMDVSLIDFGSINNKFIENRTLGELDTDNEGVLTFYPVIISALYLSDLRIDTYYLYNINQNSLYTPVQLEENEDNQIKSVINFFDLLNYLCSIFSLAVYYFNGQYVIYPQFNDPKFTIADDAVYNLDEERKFKDADYYSISQKALFARGSLAFNPTLTQLSPLYNKSYEQINLYNNAIWMFYDSSINDGKDNIFPLNTSAYDNYVRADDGFYCKRLKENIASDFKIDVITTDIITDTEHYVLKHSIDIENNYSIIEQVDSILAPLEIIADPVYDYDSVGTAANVSSDNFVKIIDATHNFNPLDVLYYDKTDSSYKKAIASSIKTLGQFVVVSAQAGSYTIAQCGNYLIPGHGLTVGNYYYLSDTTAGEVTLIPPRQQQPVLYVDSSETLYVMQLLPQENNRAKVVATLNQTLSGLRTIDGVVLSAGDKILLTAQTTAAQNGLYIVAEGAWTRADGLYIYNGLTIFIEQGTVYKNKTFIVTSPIGLAEVGTDSIVYTENISESIQILEPANQASTANINLAVSAEGTIIDGVAILIGRRYLIKEQSDPRQNGIYTINDSYTWIRTDDFAEGTFTGGALIKVSGGTVNVNKLFIMAEKEVTIASDGDQITFIDITSGGTSTIADLNDITNVVISATPSNKYLKYVGSSWVDSTVSLINGNVADVQLGSPSNGQVLKYNGAYWTNAADEVATSGTGEANTASNVGVGAGQVYKQKTGVNLELKTIKAGTNISISNDASEVTINATGTASGEANTASNLGAGTGVYASKSGVDLRFKSLVAGSNVTLSNDANTVTINATGSGGTTDHGALTGLGDDDHTQYHNNTRGDLRYLLKTNNLSDLTNAATARTNLGFAGAVTNIITDNMPTNRAMISNASGKAAESTITQGELEKLDGVTQIIETALYNKASRGAWNIFGTYLDRWKIQLGLMEAPKKNWILNGNLENITPTDIYGIAPFNTSSSSVNYHPTTNSSNSLNLGWESTETVVGQNVTLPKRRDTIKAVLSFDIKRNTNLGALGEEKIIIQVYQGTSKVDLSTMNETTLNGRAVTTASLTYIKEEGGTELTSGSLVNGNYYLIAEYHAGDNFSNIATVIDGTINTDGCVFQATGTTPTTWTNSSLLIALSARDKDLDVHTELTTTYQRLSYPFEITADDGNYLFVEFQKRNDVSTVYNTVQITNIVLNLGQIAPAEAVYADSVEDLLVAKEIEKAAYIINNLFAISDGGKIMLKNDLYEYKTTGEPTTKLANVQTGVFNTASITTDGTGSEDPYEEYKTLG